MLSSISQNPIGGLDTLPVSIFFTVFVDDNTIKVYKQIDNNWAKWLQEPQ